MPVIATVGVTSSASPVGASILLPSAVVPSDAVNVPEADELDIPLADSFAVPGLSVVPDPFVFAAPIPRGGENLPPGLERIATSSGAVTQDGAPSEAVSSPKFSSFLHDFRLTLSSRDASPVVKDSKLFILCEYVGLGS